MSEPADFHKAETREVDPYGTNVREADVMRFFRIIDGRKPKRARACGMLSCNTATREFEIQIAPYAGVNDVPMLFIPFIEKGRLTIPADWSLAWVQERIPPPNRQNIGEILEAHALDEYDELTLLLAGEGRCSQDDFMIQEVAFEEGASLFEYAVVSLPSNREIELKKAVANQVRTWRKRKSMSQTELSQRSGIPRAMVSRIENALANPTLETLAALADGMDVDVRFFFE